MPLHRWNGAPKYVYRPGKSGDIIQTKLCETSPPKTPFLEHGRKSNRNRKRKNRGWRKRLHHASKHNQDPTVKGASLANNRHKSYERLDPATTARNKPNNNNSQCVYNPTLVDGTQPKLNFLQEQHQIFMSLDPNDPAWFLHARPDFLSQATPPLHNTNNNHNNNDNSNGNNRRRLDSREQNLDHDPVAVSSSDSLSQEGATKKRASRRMKPETKKHGRDPGAAAAAVATENLVTPGMYTTMGPTSLPTERPFPSPTTHPVPTTTEPTIVVATTHPPSASPIFDATTAGPTTLPTEAAIGYQKPTTPAPT
jgi:hypothetical protein